MMDSSALHAYIISQTKQNIQFLESHNQLSPADARDILSKLDSPSLASSVEQLHLQITPANNYGPPVTAPQIPIQINHRIPSPPPRHAPMNTFRAKALWSYNEGGQEPNDLTFYPGDIIEVIDHSNVEWWTGRISGREGIFPSNYVEKLEGPSRIPPPPPIRSSNSEKFPYGPPGFPSAQTPNYPSSYPQGPPQYPAQQPLSLYGGPPISPSQQQAPPPAEPPKKHKFGKFGNTLAQSAVGGVGFGAGSAVGSGIINSIF